MQPSYFFEVVGGSKNNSYPDGVVGIKLPLTHRFGSIVNLGHAVQSNDLHVLSAALEAFRWPYMHGALPAGGTTLITHQVTLDTLAAMAVLQSRLQLRPIYTLKVVIIDRIEMLGREQVGITQSFWELIWQMGALAYSNLHLDSKVAQMQQLLEPY